MPPPPKKGPPCRLLACSCCYCVSNCVWFCFLALCDIFSFAVKDDGPSWSQIGRSGLMDPDIMYSALCVVQFDSCTREALGLIDILSKLLGPGLSKRVRLVYLAARMNPNPNRVKSVAFWVGYIIWLMHQRIFGLVWMSLCFESCSQKAKLVIKGFEFVERWWGWGWSCSRLFLW